LTKPKELAVLLGKLPTAERETAGKMIVQAESWGWTEIDLWEWLNGVPSHINDLVGVSPRQRFGFLPQYEKPDEGNEQ
jgi:hypothetical protein